MPFVNHVNREVNFKIVYYGPALSGKTTHLFYIHNHTGHPDRGAIVSLSTETDRTLFFDFLPLTMGEIRGYSTQFQLFSVPGQVFYNITRTLVLKGVDGIVFVADSQPIQEKANLDSYENLRENLNEHGCEIDDIPLVFSYNKRDLSPNVLSVDELQHGLNRNGRSYFETVAITGDGVFDSLRKIVREVIARFLATEEKVVLVRESRIQNQAKRQKEELALEIEVSFDTHFVYAVGWNPIRFKIVVTGPRSAHLDVTFEDGTDYLVKTLQTANCFTLGVDQSKLEGIVWVKPLSSTGSLTLDFQVGHIRQAKRFSVDGDLMPISFETIPRVELAAVMFVDIVDSSTLWKDKQLSILVMENLKLLLSAAIGGRGRINKAIGDAFLVTFPSPSLAILAAKRLLTLLASRAKSHAETAVSVRIGIGLGEIALETWETQAEDELFGLSVTTASRLCGLASRNEILVSSLAAEIAYTTLGDLIGSAKKKRLHLKGVGDHLVYCLS